MRALASAAIRSASALAPAMMACGLALGFAALALELGEQRLGLFLEPRASSSSALMRPDADRARPMTCDARRGKPAGRGRGESRARPRFRLRCIGRTSQRFEYFAEGGGDVVFRRSLADQPLDDGRGSIVGDAADIAHGGRTGRGDRFLGRSKLLVELRLEPLAGRFGLGRLLLARLVGDRSAPGRGHRRAPSRRQHARRPTAP